MGLRVEHAEREYVQMIPGLRLPDLKKKLCQIAEEKLSFLFLQASGLVTVDSYIYIIFRAILSKQ